MARSRNIKPSFFTNDALADVAPLGRLLFIGLWTICDYKGNLEYRPRRLKAQILPYDDCDIEKLTNNLDKYGFIRNYSVHGIKYINIVNFKKHQNPHKNERLSGSDIPEITETCSQPIDLKGVTINRDKSGLNQNKDGTSRADSLIPDPDSLIPDPDSLIHDPDSVSDIEKEFIIVWTAYGKKGNKKTALQRFKKLTKKQKSLMADHYLLYVQSTPELQYRKGLEVYINKECWNDLIIEKSNLSKTTKNNLNNTDGWENE